MALRQIVKEGDSVLTKKCRPVVKFDDRLADLIDDMIETLHKAEGVGLAAPQVGILRRVVVIDVGEGPIELVNPKIIAYSGKQETLEGCLGKEFHGWQIQQNAMTVQEAFQTALSKIIGDDFDVKGCSRTDSGVHANMYCISLKTEHPIKPERLKAALNRHCVLLNLPAVELFSVI